MAMDLNQQLVEDAKNGNLEKVKDLLEQGADIHAHGWDGPDGAVRWAARWGHLDVVRFLHPLRLVRTPDEVRAQRTNLGQSEKGADIHAADEAGPDSAVLMAARNGHLDVVRFLIASHQPGEKRSGSARRSHQPERVNPRNLSCHLKVE